MPVTSRMLTDAELQTALSMVESGATVAELVARFHISAWRWVDRRLATDRSRGQPPHAAWFTLAPQRQGVNAGARRGDQHFTPEERREVRRRIREVQRSWDPQTEQSRRLSYAADLPGPRTYRRPRQWDDRRCSPASSPHAQASAQGRPAARAW